MVVSQVDRIARLEQETEKTEHVAHVVARILSELMKSSPPPTDLERVRGMLRSARDLQKQGEGESSHDLLRQAEEGLESVRQWLGVADLAISPYTVRNFFERTPDTAPLQRSLIQYFIRKPVRAENDRDKLDYLLSAYFSGPEGQLAQPRFSTREELERLVEEFFQGLSPPELPAPAEIMVHELQSLTARIEDFSDFDALVQARVVERARALKISLGENFYHPRVLEAAIRFNLAFRQHFDELFGLQLARVREGTRQRIEMAWALIRTIETSYEAVARTSSRPLGSHWEEEAPRPASDVRVGRPLAGMDERLPLDRLMRRGEEPQKEKELTGIIARLTRFLQELAGQQLKTEAVVFPLRHTHLELALWEREAFDPAATETAPQSVPLIQYALGVTAWLEEELALFRQTSDDRYFWKPHFDYLSYGVTRAVELLRAMLELVREDAPEGEMVWFGCLLRSALRVGLTLNRVTPVFEEPARS